MKFFHRAIARRKHSNTIMRIISKGITVLNPGEIKMVMFDHFKDPLSKNDPECVFKLGSISLTNISEEQKGDLIKVFTMFEIEQALASTDGTKAPGPDGVNAGVLRSIWLEIRAEVMLLALIPKVNNPSLPSQFRPISLMNSIMKLLTKVLARRLKCVMNTLVSAHQSAFIKGRHISYSILIANEIIHSLQYNKAAGVVLKINFEKAFDKIKWEFVFEVLRAMNFDHKWVDWISSIFKSSRISVMVNGSPSSEFSPTQGLRQGDPLSPPSL